MWNEVLAECCIITERFFLHDVFNQKFELLCSSFFCLKKTTLPNTNSNPNPTLILVKSRNKFLLYAQFANCYFSQWDVDWINKFCSVLFYSAVMFLDWRNDVIFLSSVPIIIDAWQTDQNSNQENKMNRMLKPRSVRILNLSRTILQCLCCSDFYFNAFSIYLYRHFKTQERSRSGKNQTPHTSSVVQRWAWMEQIQSPSTFSGRGSGFEFLGKIWNRSRNRILYEWYGV